MVERKDIKILIACEESQAVCKAFRELGYQAYSCDILPCSGGHPEWHIQGDVLKELGHYDWDLIIAHPPCTHLAVSGARWFKEKQKDGRQQEAIKFFMELINADCPRIVVENPVCIMSSKYRKPDQIIQPWQFGHGETKTTCLWIKGLPGLKHTDIVEGREANIHKGCGFGWNTEECKKARSKTYPGIAKAMAEQWGKYLDEDCI